MSTILQIADSNKSLTSMMKAIRAADLEATLNGFGPFTIFAPVNLAFSNMLSSLDEMAKPANKAKLTDLVNFHVVPARTLIDGLRNGQKLKTVNGEELTVTVQGDSVHINGAKILARNMQGGNGVLHTMDVVNIPGVPVPVEAKPA